MQLNTSLLRDRIHIVYQTVVDYKRYFAPKDLTWNNLIKIRLKSRIIIIKWSKNKLLGNYSSQCYLKI